ncbi:glycosyltransferase family 4 protein [Allobranchiibius sp. CTAmp26]|uniref:glycosyltransferase family 4 protein n=1 Tax=Allobranchiibius sp. CTAmp26 TaxID=2815214 RepID=UPI001AA18136|nr:glycosyltransferase family 4 protein [Allobranchiibius sp. CTAmp26]MBO1756273.1 glycosyltransferase family 4 protein [Allobranchiibius sp. CTAmp26]
MRIVHVADSFPPDVGGIERQVETLARRQTAEGHDVTVITAVAEKGTVDREVSVARAAEGRWLTVAFPWRNHAMVAQILDSAPVDIVHAHFTVVSPLAIFVTREASRRGIPVAITVHSLWWKVAIATRVSTLPFGWGRMRAAWSAVSSVAAEHVRRTLLSVDEVSVLPNLVDTPWWVNPRPVPAEEAGQREVRMVLVGRLKKRKHVDEFLDALAEARKQVPPDTRVNVKILGDGPRRTDLVNQVQRLGLTDWVEFLGYHPSEDIRALFHESDLFVASSRQEAFGIAALEARSAGLPVIGYHPNGLSDFITDGVDGVLVADGAALADALAILVGQPDELRRLRVNAATLPPRVRPVDAVRAEAALYERAQAMHPERPRPALRSVSR